MEPTFGKTTKDVLDELTEYLMSRPELSGLLQEDNEMNVTIDELERIEKRLDSDEKRIQGRISRIDETLERIGKALGLSDDEITEIAEGRED